MQKLLFFFAFFHVFVLFSQTEICGSIYNVDSEPLMGVTLLVKQPEGEDILAYAISKADGSYCIKLNTKVAILSMEIRSMGYASKSISVENKSQLLNHVLEKTSTELETVVLKALPIIQKGDTINYSVNSFTREHDRSIGDVLSRMPGFDVLDDGKILYQGKAINKFYINNMDLLEGRYNLANKNLPHKEVLQVQVLENHQPVKILDGVVLSDRAAVNIQLKNPITMTGQAILGAGASPLLWDVNLSPMLFNPQKQVLISYQTNNTGEDVGSQLKVLTLEDLVEREVDKPWSSDWLGIKNIQAGQIAKQRALDNNVHMLSVNYLQRLKKDLDLRVRTSYINDFQRAEGDIHSSYFLMGDTTAAFEQIKNKFSYNSLESEVNVERNREDGYLKNTLKFRGDWKSRNGDLFLDEQGIQQRLNQDNTALTNNFKSILPVAGNLITFQSVLHLDKKPETLRVQPGVFTELLNAKEDYAETLQDLQMQTFFTNNSLRFTKKWEGFSLSPRVGFILDKQHLQSHLLTEGTSIQNSEFKNDLRWNKTDVYADLSSSFKYDKWTISLQAPFHWYDYELKAQTSLEGERLSRFVFNPLLNLGYDLTSNWKWSSSVSSNKGFGSINQLYSAYILTSYQNIQRTEAAIPESKTQLFTSAISYKNLMSSVFWNLSYSKLKTSNNLLFVTQLLENGAKQVETVLQDNDTYTQAIRTDFTKYFYTIRSNFKLNLAYATSKSHQILNKELTELQVESLNIGSKVDVEVTDWFNFTYEYDWMKSFNQLQNQKNTDMRRQSHKAQLHLYPTKAQYIGWENSYIESSLFNSSSNNFFSDLVYRYTIKKKNIDLEWRWQNIFNTQNYRSIHVSDYSYVQSTTLLRPSQVLVKVRFSF